jgi:hypothetical protein
MSSLAIAKSPSSEPAESTPGLRPSSVAAEAKADAEVDAESDALGFGAAPEVKSEAPAPAEDALGFGTPAAVPAKQEAAPEWFFSGRLRSDDALWLERTPRFAKARLSLDLALRYQHEFAGGSSLRVLAGGHGEYDFAYLTHFVGVDAETERAYRYRVHPRETYLGLAHKALELDVGYQIVGWGEGEMLSVVDVVNPRDYRDPGATDIEQLRLALFGARAAGDWGSVRVNLFATASSEFPLRPPPLAPFSGLRSLLVNDRRVAAFIPGRQVRYREDSNWFAPEEPQGFLRVGFSNWGLDLDFYAASVLDRPGVIALPTDVPSLIGLIEPDRISLPLAHPRYWMFGHSGSYPFNDVALRWEVALDLDRPLNVGTVSAMNGVLAVQNLSQVAGLLSLAYTGVEHVRMTLEYQHNLLLEPIVNPGDGTRLELLSPTSKPALAVRLFGSALQDRVALDLVGMVFGSVDYSGWLGRAELSYEPIQGFKAGVGYLTFHPEATVFGPVFGLTDTDQLFCNATWNFGSN